MQPGARRRSHPRATGFTYAVPTAQQTVGAAPGTATAAGHGLAVTGTGG